MRILLVNPPKPFRFYNREYYLPSSLMYLAAVFKKNGDEVKIVDLKTFDSTGAETQQQYDGFHRAKLIEAVSEFRPEIIGFGCLFSGNFPELVKLSAVCREKFCDIPVVAGGIHPTIYATDILKNCPSVDWIVLGEGEESAVQLVNVLKKGGSEFGGIDGIAYKHNGKIVVNPKTKFIEDADTIPFPAYDLVDLKDYYVDTSNWHNPKNLPINTSVPIISSRSCPRRCSFCSMFRNMGPSWRPRSPENVVDEIEFVYNKYSHRHFSFMDDNLTLKKSHVLGICNLIAKRNLDIQFETPNGLSIITLDEEVMDALVSAGMVRTGLAIESGSDFIRNKIMKKNLPREKIYEVVELTRKYEHLFVNAFFIMGMPEETRETLQDTYDMIRDINVDKVLLMNIVPFAGTEVFEQALRDGLLVDCVPENLYMAGDRYFTNYGRFFIKPYKLELDDLREFRKKCDDLIAKKKDKKMRVTAPGG
ncbi:MAG: radical SAM protein [bacterium]